MFAHEHFAWYERVRHGDPWGLLVRQVEQDLNPSFRKNSRRTPVADGVNATARFAWG